MHLLGVCARAFTCGSKDEGQRIASLSCVLLLINSLFHFYEK